MNKDCLGIDFICVVKDGIFVYYPVEYNHDLGCHKISLDDCMICNFNEIEKSGEHYESHRGPFQSD